MLVVVHQHDRVAFLAEEFVIIRVVARRQSDHEFQSCRVEHGREGGDEFAEVLLAGVGNFFKIDDNACLVRINGIRGDVPREILPGGRIRKHLRHFLDAPLDAVVVVDEAHHGQLDRRIQRLHPLVQLVFFQNRNSLGRCGFRGVLAALVIHDGQRAIGRHGMELLGNQQVDVFVMLLERSKAVGIPAHQKCSPNGIIACRELSDVRDAAAAPFACK